MYTADLRVGENYSKLNHCISIAILDFNLSERQEYHSVYKLRDTAGNLFSDIFEIHTIELRKKLTGNAPVNDWIRFFNAESEADLAMIKSKNPGIQKAIEELKHFSLNPHLRLRCEAYLKEKRDQQAIEEYAREQAIAEGMSIGIERGIKQGIEQGIEQGQALEWERSIQTLILDNLEEHKTEEIIIAKLVKHFSLTEESALEYYSKLTR